MDACKAIRMKTLSTTQLPPINFTLFNGSLCLTSKTIVSKCYQLQTVCITCSLYSVLLVV